jgi:xanthine/CO dehydrogenase XdhC/CoxF family maturation factor
LERRTTAGPLLAILEQAFVRRVPLAVATVVEGRHLGRRAFAGLEQGMPQSSQPKVEPSATGNDSLQDLAEQAIASRESIEGEVAADETHARAWADYRSARAGLGIFGAGDDAQPLLRLAKELGWFVSVADGRSQLITRERFPMADELSILPIKDLPGAPLGESMAAFSNLHREDAAVVMTHSFEQDAAILACLLALDAPPAYIGVLGPQRRTRELLAEAARLLDLPASAVAAQEERWLAQIHAPTGLDLGAESPETIALSVLAEIQKFRTAATALPLRKVRASAVTIAG